MPTLTIDTKPLSVFKGDEPVTDNLRVMVTGNSGTFQGSYRSHGRQ
ncbi:MAG: hypothetical protein AAFQ98_27180 [Bacteroidota bacterium]